MLLAVDVGNTNVVFALFDAGAMRTRWRIATDPRRTGDEYAVWLMQLLQIHLFLLTQFFRQRASSLLLARSTAKLHTESQ